MLHPIMSKIHLQVNWKKLMHNKFGNHNVLGKFADSVPIRKKPTCMLMLLETPLGGEKHNIAVIFRGEFLF